MIDIKIIRDNPDQIKKACQAKNCDSQIIDRLLKVDDARHQLIEEVEKWRQQRNQLQPGEIEKGKKIKEMLKKIEPDLRAVEEQFNLLLCQVPGPAAPDVPLGPDESGNIVLKKWGELPQFPFPIKDHCDLGESLDLIDVKRGAKVSGARFGYLKNEAVLLEFALVAYASKLLLKEGFKPVVPPILISKDSMAGMGYLEHGGDSETYFLPKDDLYLIGTSEQALGPLHAGETIPAKDLPLRYFGFSPCFRREAGSYGKDTRGIFRVHQFYKVEMFSFTLPEKSDAEHEYLLSLEEKLMQGLNLPYQVIKMCTGDLGNPAARKYDIEAWFPAQQKYRETHSTSTCTDFQSRRLKIKYQDGQKTDYLHTLNGTAFALGRTLLAILENNQQKDGSVLVPPVLLPFTGFDKIKKE